MARPNNASTTSSDDSDNGIGIDIGIQLDLPSLCKRHYRFLKMLHEEGVTKNVTAESLRRYRLWIALLAKSYVDDKGVTPEGRSLMVPPKDVVWLWHCHRLNPAHYEEFLQTECMTYVKQGQTSSGMLDFKDPSGDPYALQSDVYSEQIWKRYYPIEPFALDKDANDRALADSSSKKTTIHGLDLLASAKSQAEFYYQIQPMFQGTSKNPTPTLDSKQAAQNYRKFLNLLQKYPKLSYKLVPTYEIDLMWHTHMTGKSLYKYHADCELICGKLIDHDDSYGDGDRSKDAVLTKSFQKTAKLWNDEYKDKTYAQKGGYRGPPPSDYFPSISYPSSFSTEIAVVATKVEDIEASLEKPDAKEDSSSDSKWPCGGRFSPKNCCLFFVLIMLAGGGLLYMGNTLLVEEGYACGSEPPSLAEIEARGAPVCLNTNVRENALCLEGGLDPNEPARWCQEEIKTSELDKNFYLWWSSCTTCGTSWRMFWENSSDNTSRYKIPADEPEIHETPTLDTFEEGWLEWDYTNEKWLDARVTFSECQSPVDEFGIPEECYQERNNSLLVGLGLLFLVLGGLLVFCVGGLLCLLSCNCPRGGGNGHSTSHTGYHGYGGYGGGGGGGGCGGGGGGGGCGGC